MIRAAKVLNTTVIELENWAAEWIDRALIYENVEALVTEALARKNRPRTGDEYTVSEDD